MIGRSPSEFYVKYLLSLQKYDVDMVVQIAEDFGLCAVTPTYIRSLLRRIEPFPSKDMLNDRSRQWLKTQGIHDLWFPTPAVQEAYSILSEAQMRSDLEQMLLSPLKPAEIVDRLKKHYDFNLSVEGVEAFSHYFLKKSLLSADDCISLLDGSPRGYAAATVLRTSPDMAMSVVPWVIGLGNPPTNITSGTVARRTRDIAFLKVLEIERHPATIAHSKMLKNYGDVIKGMEDEMRQSDVVLKDVLRVFEKFQLNRDNRKIPTIEEVAGGNYSQSGEADIHNPLADDDDEPDVKD